MGFKAVAQPRANVSASLLSGGLKTLFTGHGRELSLAPGEVQLLPEGIDDREAWEFEISYAMPGLDGKMLEKRAKILGAQKVTLTHGRYRVRYRRIGGKSYKHVLIDAEAERTRLYDVSFAKP